MKVIFARQFGKEIGKITDKKLAGQIEEIILAVKSAPDINQISNLKKLKGFSNCYRIRVGEYRIGIYLNKDTVEFARLLHRKDIYKYFP